jgi:uncharacterized membrane protein YhaH (DUF805 family)
MAAWVLPFAAASLAVLLLNGALLVQRARERSRDWPAQFLRDLRRWDGVLPDDVRDT